MSAAEKAEEAKAAGNAAMKAGNFDEAIAQFTTAIEADATNHVLYSNRSAAHASKSSFTEALIDANKCIDLKGDWAKGHSRRGAAYFGLKNWIQAQSSYEKGLELDPSSQVMKDELEKVKLMRNPAARAAATATPPGMQPPSTGPVAKMVSLMALGCGVVYAVPIFGAQRAFISYKISVVQILLLFVINLWNRFPKKMATLSDASFKSSMEVQAFVLVIFMLLSPPMPFALMPFLSIAFLNVVHGYAGYIAKLPEFARSRLIFFTTPEGTFQVNAFGVVSEIIVTFMGPMLFVVQGARALVLSFLYFQYVCRRYKTNAQTVQTVRLFVEKVDGIGKHRYVPAPIQTAYGRVKWAIGFAAEKLR